MTIWIFKKGNSPHALPATVGYTRGGFSLVWFSLGFDVGLVQNHKRWSTLIQRILFRSSSQVNVDTIQIPFSHHVVINVDGPEQRPVEHEAKPNQRKPAPDCAGMVAVRWRLELQGHSLLPYNFFKSFQC